MLIRVLFWFGTLAGGMNLTWVRLGIWAAHVAGAVGCAILCARWTGSKLAGWFAGTLYAGALGFIGEQIWWPSSGIFCLGVTFLIFAMAALDRSEDALCWAVLMLVIAALGMNGDSRCRHWDSRFAIVCDAGDAAGVLLGVPRCWRCVLAARAARSGARIFGARPGTWRVAGFHRAISILQRIHNVRAAQDFEPFGNCRRWRGWRCLASAWFMNRASRRILLAVWTPAVLLALLVGMARADYPFRFGPGSLYTADRYYYFFLFPLVTHCVLFLKPFELHALRDALFRAF